MNTLVASLINTMLPAVALVAAVEILFRSWRNITAATRFTVWWLVLLATLLLPLLSLPQKQLPALQPATIAITPGDPAPRLEEPGAQTAPPLSRPIIPMQAPDLAAVLLPFVLLGSAALLARILFSYAWLRRTKLRASLSARSPRMDHLLLRYGISRPARLLESERVKSPIAAGFRRPAVILPEGLALQLSPEELDHVLLHEMAHLARRDDWMNLAARLLQALLWFHPAVRWILHRLEQEREMACDEWAVRASGERKRYAASLARLVELRLESRTSMLATGALGGKPQITRRIESLLKNAKAPRLSFPKIIASAAAIALFIFVCSQSPELIAAEDHADDLLDVDLRPPQPPDPPADPASPAPPTSEENQVGRGFLGGLAAAGYTSLSVDDLIELKNNGVTPAYAAEVSRAGLGRLSPQQLILLHNHGVKPDFMRLVAGSGLPRLTLRDLVDLASHGVNASEVAEIHSLGFGPYSPQQFIEFTQRGVGVKFFRQLKELHIPTLDPKDIIEAASQGVTAKDILEAHRYHPNIKMQQIVKLKQAGVI